MTMMSSGRLGEVMHMLPQGGCLQSWYETEEGNGKQEEEAC